MIDDFRGPNRFLSNYALSQVIDVDGLECRTVEHAYQLAKSEDATQRAWIRSAPSPGESKRRAKTVTLRSDWEEIKIEVMGGLLRQKFLHLDLKEKLLATDNQELVEGNTWGDVFWGVCRGYGENHLGRLLMTVRAELQQES